jgi:hypothetical protein
LEIFGILKFLEIFEILKICRFKKKMKILKFSEIGRFSGHTVENKIKSHDKA